RSICSVSRRRDEFGNDPGRGTVVVRHAAHAGMHRRRRPPDLDAFSGASCPSASGAGVGDRLSGRAGSMELPTKRGGLMAVQRAGTYFEHCNCDMVCPCTTSGLSMPADQERCRLVLTFHVERGDVEGVDVSGKTVVVLADAPALMSEGNWRVGVVMDASASPD